MGGACGENGRRPSTKGGNMCTRGRGGRPHFMWFDRIKREPRKQPKIDSGGRSFTRQQHCAEILIHESDTRGRERMGCLRQLSVTHQDSMSTTILSSPSVLTTVIVHGNGSPSRLSRQHASSNTSRISAIGCTSLKLRHIQRYTPITCYTIASLYHNNH